MLVKRNNAANITYTNRNQVVKQSLIKKRFSSTVNVWRWVGVEIHYRTIKHLKVVKFISQLSIVDDLCFQLKIM